MTIPGEYRRFRVLYRAGLSHLVNFDVLGGSGKGQNLAIRLVSILAGLSFALAFMLLPRYLTATLRPAELARLAWNDEEFLISTTIAVAALFAVLAWNSVFPDKRDSFVLGLLPVRVRTFLLAKLAAILTALAIGVAAINAFTGTIFPFVVAGGLRQGFHFLAASWLALFAAGSFAFFSALTLQGIASQLLPWRMFLRLSTLLQFAVLFAALGLFFLTPPFDSLMQATAAHAQNLATFIPSFWFTGLFHVLRGDRTSLFVPLAARASLSLVVVIPLAMVLYALAYVRNTRRVVEAPDVPPGNHRRPLTRILDSVATIFNLSSLDRAILLFTARTIARSRPHRLLLAALSGAGLAVSLAFSRSFLEGMLNDRWNEPNALTMDASALMLFFAIVGMRAMFVLPIALPDNWIFQITVIRRPALYFAAVRKTLLVLAGVPVWLVSGIVYFAIWPVVPALEHIAVLFLAGVLLLDLSLHQFSKIPFACSHLPPEPAQRMKACLYCALFVAFSSTVMEIELWAMSKPTRFAVFLSMLFAAAVWARRRTAEFARSARNSIQFEDLPAADLLTLDLSREAPSYADALADLPKEKERQIDEEIEFHIRMEIQNRVERGELPEAAGAAVLREFGNKQLVKETTRAVWTWTTLEQILQDLRSGARILKKSPVFSAAAVALIAVGIGGNTTIFSMIHAILTKPATGVTADRLVTLGLTEDGRLTDPSNSFPNYLDYAAQTRTMRSIVAIGSDRATLALRDGTYEMRCQLVSQNYFQTLGVHLTKGRAFTSDEANGASGLAAVIAWHVWRIQFHGDQDIIGRPVVLNGFPATIVGVTVEGFHGIQFAPNFEIGLPLVSYLRTTGREFVLTDRTERSVVSIGKLASGASLSEAQAEFTAISKRLQTAYPDANKAKMVVLAPYSATTFGAWQSAQA